MAVTTAAALGDSTFAELVQRDIVKELRPAMTTRAFLRFAPKGPSPTASFPLYGDPGAAAPITDDSSDITSTTLSDTEQSATAAEIGFLVEVSDVSRLVNVSNLAADVARMVAAALAEKWELDLASLMDDFSNVTTAGSTLTPLDLLAAVSALEQRDVEGTIVGYFDPKQTGELRAEIATTTAQYEGGGRNADKVAPMTGSGRGFFGTYMGIPIWQTTQTQDTAGLIGGAVFVANQALGCYELYGPRIETERNASLRTTEFVGSQSYGFKEISDTRGQTVKSAA